MTHDPAPKPALDYRNPTHADGKRRPPSAKRIILWSFGTLFALLVLFAIFLPSIGRARETAQRVRCASNLKQIGMAAWTYANEHQGHLPPNLCVIQSEGNIDPSIFICPSRDLDAATGATPDQIKTSMLSGDHVGYVWVGAGLTNESRADVILAFDLEHHVPKDGEHTTGINVLLGDSSTIFVDEPTSKFIWAQFVTGVRPIRLRLPPATTQRSTP